MIHTFNDPQFFANVNEFIKSNPDLWWDIDGTLIADDKTTLTPLGEFVRDQGIRIQVLTFGAWSVGMLSECGIIATIVVTIGEALGNGMADYTEDGEVSKKVKSLIDNENHPLTPNLFRVDTSSNVLYN